MYQTIWSILSSRRFFSPGDASCYFFRSKSWPHPDSATAACDGPVGNTQSFWAYPANSYKSQRCHTDLVISFFICHRVCGAISLWSFPNGVSYWGLQPRKTTVSSSKFRCSWRTVSEVLATVAAWLSHSTWVSLSVLTSVQDDLCWMWCRLTAKRRLSTGVCFYR